MPTVLTVPPRFSSAHHGLSYLAFALGFIFPCAQRCFSSRDSFLRAAALMGIPSRYSFATIVNGNGQRRGKLSDDGYGGGDMIPTIGVMVGVYILMRCIVVFRNACKPASNANEFLSILSVVAGAHHID